MYTSSVLYSPPSYGFPVPSVLAIVELSEGYVMFSNVLDCEPEEVEIGMAVRVRFEAISDAITLPFFQPA